MKLLFIIAFLWIIYQIKKVISNIGITNSKNNKNNEIDRKTRMDIQDAEYEEVE